MDNADTVGRRGRTVGGGTVRHIDRRVLNLKVHWSWLVKEEVVGIRATSVEGWKEESSDTSESKGHGTEKIML